MKLNVKSLMLVLGTGIVFSLSGCGGGSSTSADSDPAPGEVGYQVLSEDGQSITYLDANLNERNASLSAGAAEYHTGVDFNNTLFDSADKKCQNCHNELYDTWKSSMHGQSWVDPIFQSKFQDFLRTQIAKIGSTGPGGEYTPGKFEKGVSLTCIKCHAPGAYYAGDVKVKLTPLKSNPTTQDLIDAKVNEQKDPDGEIKVVSASGITDTLYEATFQIGHEANREGINCAFCHSIETVRMMKGDGADNGNYTLAKSLREGPIGPEVYAAGETLTYDERATDHEMNAFFRLWGPEKYHDNLSDIAYTPKDNFDKSKKLDGRYTMTSKDINGTNDQIHFTGGPFYGPYGVTGISNENETDETNRTALVNPHYNIDTNNHFGNHGKALCLSCHQRSAGAIDPASNGIEGKQVGDDTFMELCSTWNAVTAIDGTNYNDTDSSPKCQKCHMERIQGTVLHQWARPDKLFTLVDNPALTGHFNPDDPDEYGDENPVASGWLNSHAFLGASVTGQTESVKAKIQSGFEANVTAEVVGNTLTVNTEIQNLTAHMFPGAHPMRRVYTIVKVTDESDNPIVFDSAEGKSEFDSIVNKVQTLNDKTLHSSAEAEVKVDFIAKILDFPGKEADLSIDGETVKSQKFDGSKVAVVAPDGTVADQFINEDGAIEGNVTNAAIVDDLTATDFARIYGHETGKVYGDVFVVRPGFDSNTVAKDNRLSPNEKETYTITYDVTNVANKAGVKVTYTVYYLQKGAGGKAPKATEIVYEETILPSMVEPL